MASLSFKNIKKAYDKNVVAVEDFNLEIKDKEFVVLVGPSGCGKSTTLRMVAGLEDISGGELYIGDKRVNNVAPKDRDIAMVFQSYALYPHMTVYDNMAFALKMRKEKKEVINQKVMEAARILDITDYLKRRPKALSGGQRQRVAIGRAIVRNPDVFLMDEPLSNLDAKLRSQMRAELIRLRAKVDTTFIYVTHDQTEAMTLGDRIVIMNAGKVQQVGTPAEVFNYPINTFVAGFIGMPQMNFFDGRIEKANGKYIVSVYGAKIELQEDMQKRLDKNPMLPEEITVGIRPEHILISNNAVGDNAINAVLSVSEMMGSETYLHVDPSKEHVDVQSKDVIIRISTMEANAGYLGLTNEEVNVKFVMRPELLHLFDVKSGKNLLYDLGPDNQILL